VGEDLAVRRGDEGELRAHGINRAVLADRDIRERRVAAVPQVGQVVRGQQLFDLARDGFTRGEGTLYAIGRLVLVVPAGSPLAPDGTLERLREALDAGRISRFSIANPEHAPYGRAAREALESRGLWEAVEPHLVLGENVTQAAQFALTGNAQAGIVAYSLVLAEGIGTRFADRPLVEAEIRSTIGHKAAARGTIRALGLHANPSSAAR
jgi:hypothetical protein